MDLRTLNRTTLQRQLLLRRSAMTPLEAVRHLVALQGQEPNPPYIGLWSRLESFTHEELTGLLYGRQVVRSSLLRATQHLTAAEDYLWLRPLMDAPMRRSRQAAFGRVTRGLDLEELARVARKHLTGQTLTRPQLATLLAERWPHIERLALGWSAQSVLPLVHVPPNGTWNRYGATPFTLAEEWLGRPLEAAPPVERLVTRYLAAFGPATVMDVQAWSGLTRLREVMEAMPLRRHGKLYDLPDAPPADPDTPAPVRFLPWFDNLMVAYADRTRVMSDQARSRVCVGAIVYPTFLVDGTVGGIWNIHDGALHLLPFDPLPDETMGELEEEGARLLAFTGMQGASITWHEHANCSTSWPPSNWPGPR
ncbi:winged helix DNA-binding domain-containing protein [Thermoactinospora rubra]|uniref:winged helix DNA-binding domain-containing protein n=1 Tax=Thermoactinospora rubra TaxID=1088767 RepID=UPI001F0B6026|nr:winged helix DNA-binding domain-containing protein [Thermoactinospora rubra]